MSDFPKSSIPDLLTSDGKKMTKKYKEESLDAIINECVNTGGRKTNEEIDELEGIVRGIVTENLLKKAINPLNLEVYDTIEDLFAEDKTYSILNGVVNTLVGEQLQRMYDIKAYVINPDAVSSKEEKIKKRVFEAFKMAIEDPNIDPAETVKQMTKFKHQTMQSLEEKMANQILQYFKVRLPLRETFKEGFKRLIIHGSPVYYVGSDSDDPYVRQCNIKNLYFSGLGESGDVSKADKIVEITMMSIGDVIAKYGRYMTKNQIKELLGEKYRTDTKMTREFEYGYERDVLLNIDEEGNSTYNYADAGPNYDYKGNVKVYTATWKTYMYVNMVKYYDEYGDPQFKFVHEDYELDIEAGEEIMEEIPVPEYWTGTRIGDNIRVNIGPREIQMRSLDNPAICRSPYVGRISNDSLIDDLLPWAVDYVIYAKRLKELWISNIGKVALIDLSMIPSGKDWDLELWHKWVRKFRFGVVDSFKQDPKSGMVAGNMQKYNNVIDLSLGNEINQVVDHLEYIETVIERRSGVYRQRQGQQMASDGLGVTQQAIVRSAVQSEELFFIQDTLMREVYELLLSTAQYLWKDKSIAKQYAMDDGTLSFLKVHGTEFAAHEYNIFLTDGSRTSKLESMLENYIFAQMQNNMLDASSLPAIFASSTPTSMATALKAAEEEKLERQKQIEQQNAQNQERLIQMQQQFEFQKMELEHKFKMQELQMQAELETLKLKMNLAIKNMDLVSGMEETPSMTDSEREKLDLERQKMERQTMDKDKDRAFKEKELKQRELLEREKLSTMISENSKDRSLQRATKKSTTKQ